VIWPKNTHRCSMKMMKSLLLGSAAGLAAVTGAQAADMPVKARPGGYVRICSLYGGGVFYIPRTDTCLKVGRFPGGPARVQRRRRRRRDRLPADGTAGPLHPRPYQ